MREELSDTTLLGRFGPDEFLAVAPPECAHDLEPAIERLRTRLMGADKRECGQSLTGFGAQLRGAIAEE